MMGEYANRTHHLSWKRSTQADSLRRPRVMWTIGSPTRKRMDRKLVVAE